MGEKLSKNRENKIQNLRKQSTSNKNIVGFIEKFQR